MESQHLTKISMPLFSAHLYTIQILIKNSPLYFNNFSRQKFSSVSTGFPLFLIQTYLLDSDTIEIVYIYYTFILLMHMFMHIHIYLSILKLLFEWQMYTYYKNYGSCSISISLLKNIKVYIPRSQFLPDLFLSKQKRITTLQNLAERKIILIG